MVSVPSLPKPLQQSWQVVKRLAAIQPKEGGTTVGLDVGSSSIKAVALGPHKTLGSRRVLGQQLVELTAGDESRVPDAIRQALNGLRVPRLKGVTMAVSGQWVVLRVVEMPTLTPDEFRQALPFEAQRSLPFNIQDVVLDGAVLGASGGSKMWVLVAACKKDVLERRLAWVKQAGCDVTTVDVDALALANAFLEHADHRGRTDTPALINVGAQWTNLAVLKAGVPYLVRDIPWGAEKFIQDIAQRCSVDQPAALAQLRQPTLPPPQAFEAFVAACEPLVQELQLSFDFFESHFGPSPSPLLLSGGLSLSVGFLEALKKHLTQPLVPWPFSQRVSNQFAIAYGLALRV